jgi:glycosyltransferase involved in cell wall biosynthesis
VSDGITPIAPAEPEPRPAHIALGMTVYNGERYLVEALDSVLSQNYRDFTLVVLDDCSADRSVEILTDRASREPRMLCFRNNRRNGMIATWVKVFRLSQAYCPGHPYFGWCSDHDLLEPNWLALLADVLNNRAEAVMAYPETLHIDSEGHLSAKPRCPRRFDTRGLNDPFARFGHANRRLSGAGDMIYGLMRSSALDAISVYRPVLQPDRLALVELSLFGQIHQVPQVLRYRRVTGEASIERQKATLFNPSGAEKKASAPWYIMHAITFFRAYASPSAPAQFSSLRVVALSISILCWQFWADLEKKFLRSKRVLKWLWKRTLRPLWHAVTMRG